LEIFYLFIQEDLQLFKYLSPKMLKNFLSSEKPAGLGLTLVLENLGLGTQILSTESGMMTSNS